MNPIDPDPPRLHHEHHTNAQSSVGLASCRGVLHPLHRISWMYNLISIRRIDSGCCVCVFVCVTIALRSIMDFARRPLAFTFTRVCCHRWLLHSADHRIRLSFGEWVIFNSSISCTFWLVGVVWAPSPCAEWQANWHYRMRILSVQMEMDQQQRLMAMSFDGCWWSLCAKIFSGTHQVLLHKQYTFWKTSAENERLTFSMQSHDFDKGLQFNIA